MNTNNGKMGSKCIQFTADKVRVNGPKIDGSYTVTFETGEYTAEQIAELIKIPQQTIMEVKVWPQN